jgi:ribosome biogenesis GTPase A
MVKPLRLVICGIPNVGKSTLINTLMGRRAAAAADEAGVTMAEQRLQLASDCYLVDTPGMLWPRIAVPQSGVLLAATGAVGRNAYDEEALAHELLPLLRVRHEAALAQRYALADAPGLSDEAVLQAIARRRGGLMSGGRLNLHKAGEALLQDLRSGALGALTLETPQEFAGWSEAAAQADVEREARRAAVRELQRGRKPQRGLMAEVARELGDEIADEVAQPGVTATALKKATAKSAKRPPAKRASTKVAAKAGASAARARTARSRPGRPG